MVFLVDAAGIIVDRHVVALLNEMFEHLAGAGCIELACHLYSLDLLKNAALKIASVSSGIWDLGSDFESDAFLDELFRRSHYRSRLPANR